MLRTQMWQGVPAGIEEHKHGTDMMLRRDGQETVDARLKTACILLPEQVVWKNAHGVHAHRFSPAQFFINFNRIESRLLPHLQLVDRRLGKVVTADQPRLLRVPGIGLLLRPTRGLGPQHTRAQARNDHYRHDNALHSFHCVNSPCIYMPRVQDLSMVQPRDATNAREGTETHCCAKLTPAMPTFAAIDIGSNSVRLKIARL